MADVSTPESLGPGIHRFRSATGEHDVPFPAYERPPVVEGTATGDIEPVFDIHKGRARVTVRIERDTSLFGTGEVSGPLRRNGRVIECWNTDAFSYTDESRSLYQSHPWVLAVRQDGTSFGILVETTHRCRIDLRDHIVFEHEGPDAAAVVIEGDNPEAVLKRLSTLIGRMELPPKWALGYHQCRWSYKTEERVLEVAREFRERSIPCDCIWFDIDYMDGFRCFTFDSTRFPDPSRVNRLLHEQGFHTIWMIDPGIKVDPDYAVYASGADHFVRDASGEPFVGEVWPGDCVFPDFTNEACRRWWAGLYGPYMATGIDGVWNDMNEPSVFFPDPMPREDRTMEETCAHRADEDLGGPGTHAKYHNVYGMQMIRATLEGVKRAKPDRRPFVLTRSNFLGGHRYAATWTGDNVSDWTHLGWSIPMILNLGLSGQAFSGPDIGGFAGNATPELFARWMGIGALLPFARGHSIDVSEDHEPWSFGPETEAICREAIERRMRLLPYLYTQFEASSRTGLPVARPVLFADPADVRLHRVDDAFLLGPDLLVRCATDLLNMQRSVMPRGDWRPILEGHDQLPSILLRPGAIVPSGPVMQYVGERPTDHLTLHINMKDGEACGTLYLDEGDGYGHREGRFARIGFEARDAGDVVVVRVDGDPGATLDCVLRGDDRPVRFEI